MRNFSKNKFLLCFRPVVHIDAMLESKGDAQRSPTSRDKHHTMNNSHSKSLYFPHLSPKRTISRAIKAVFFETILNRRVHHKNRFSLSSLASKKGYSKYIEAKTPESPTSTSISSRGSASPSSCSLRLTSPQSKNGSKYGENSTNEKRREDNKHMEWYGIYLVLISLIFTVLLGKVFGIILTSILLYLFSLSQKRVHFQRSYRHHHRQSLQGKDRGYHHYGKTALKEQLS